MNIDAPSSTMSVGESGVGQATAGAGVDAEDTSNAAAQRRVPTSSFGRVAYLAIIGVAAAFALAVFAINAIEAHGPLERQLGEVLERSEGENTVRYCTPGRATSRCREVTYPTYTVTGERNDGSTWLVVGEDAFDAVGSGPVVVETSSVTGRVAGLGRAIDGGRLRWHVADSSSYALAWGLLLFIGAVLWALEFGRRKHGKIVTGSFSSRERLVLVPAAVAGGVAAWWMLFSPTWGLESPPHGEEQPAFLADPLVLVGGRPQGAESGVTAMNPVGTLVSTGRTTVYVVPPDQLADSAQVEFDAARSWLVIPVAVMSEAGGRRQFVMVPPGDDPTTGRVEQLQRPGSCPSALLEYHPRDRPFGYLCFPGAAAGDDLYFVTGTAQSITSDDVFRFDYPGR